MQIHSKGRQLGFSMIEILVTLVIIAIALLGTVGLQLYAMRGNQSSQFRTQAIFLASDMSERMEANKAQAINGAYILAQTQAAPTLSTACSTGICTPSALATYDLNQWGNSVANLLPQASWQITQTTAGNPSTYSILISWTERSTDKTTHVAETFSYTATRTLSN